MPARLVLVLLLAALIVIQVTQVVGEERDVEHEIGQCRGEAAQFPGVSGLILTTRPLHARAYLRLGGDKPKFLGRTPLLVSYTDTFRKQLERAMAAGEAPRVDLLRSGYHGHVQLGPPPAEVTVQVVELTPNFPVLSLFFYIYPWLLGATLPLGMLIVLTARRGN
ncbi:MAG: hypothetical protein FJX76_08975 [Armatimonadetes bacterium]|nr:hypothetical protein [Armatimonadota bacterium]